MINAYTIIGALAGIGVSFGIGVQVGSKFTASNYQERLISEMQLASDVYEVRLGELEQCRGQVDGFNLAVADQERQLSAMRREQAEAREEARESASLRDAEISAANIRVQSALNKLKGQLNELSLSPCAGAVVDTGLIELLNTELRNAGAIRSGRDGELSGGESGDRP